MTTPSKSSKSKMSSIGSGNSFDWSSSTTSLRSQAADQVRKLGLIFTYCKSEVSGQSGLEIRTRPTPKRDC